MSETPRNWKLDCKVYIGDLGYGATKQELEDIFDRYGKLKNVWVARNPPGFAFVEFEDADDAEKACERTDGIRINGRRVRVEMSSGKSRWGNRGPPPNRRGGGGYDRRRRSRSRSPRSRRSPLSQRRNSRSRSRSGSPLRRSRSPYDSRRGRRDWI